MANKLARRASGPLLEDFRPRGRQTMDAYADLPDRAVTSIS